jgi:hypothetical protein
MDLVQQTNAESLSPKGRIERNRVGIWLVIVGAALCVSIAAWLLVANAGIATVSSTPSAADPFTQAAAIEFRGTEHEVMGASAADPLTQPAAIQFRRMEHEGTRVAASDPFTGPAAIEFREGEHEGSR